MRELPFGARLYVAAVVLAGALVIAADVYLLTNDPDRRTAWLTVVGLCFLVLVANLLLTPLRRAVVDAPVVSISIDVPVGIASVLLLGPAGAPLVMGASALMPSMTKLPAFKKLFNAAMLALATWVAALVYARLGGVPIEYGVQFDARRVILPILVAALMMEAVNAILMVTVIALTEHVSPLRVWFGTMAESALPLFVYSIFGLLIAVVWSFAGPISAVLVLAPLMVARWVFAQFAARQAAYEATMRSLIKAVETKDLYTRGHSERVSRASVLIGRASGMREDRVTMLRYAGTLHDVGKLGVPTRVLQKAGKLTDEEYEAIQQHPTRGREITRELEFLGEAIEGIHYHHERIDGRGYPMGLKGEEIPEFARIIAVADAFDSMTTTRSYRGARTIEDAVLELRRCKGSQFDPVMVEALIEAIEAHGWDVTDTLPEILPAPAPASVPTLGSDDDDPTARDSLAELVAQGRDDTKPWAGE
jgi:hypothetical protein